MGDTIIEERYRAHLVKWNTVIVVFVSVIEILLFLMFLNDNNNNSFFSFNGLFMNVVLPMFINFSACCIARIANNSGKVDRNYKNKAVLYSILVVAVVVANFHREYAITSCSYIFPVVLSAVYNNEKILAKIFSFSLASLSFTMSLFIFEKTLTIERALDLIVAYGFVSVSYVAAYVFVEFSRRNSKVIETQNITNNELKITVLKDPMTGLFNHKAFYGELEESVKLAQDDKVDFCLAMIDVDNFKTVNDKYGHKNGDLVLKALARILQCNCDGNAKICRYGGEEFTVIFNNKTILECQTIMNNVLNEFRKEKYNFTKDLITFSCGIAKYHKNETKEDIFNLADKYMYEAKSAGKNRVKIETFVNV